MGDLGFIGYGIAAVFFLVFSLLLLTSWRGRLQGGLMVAGALASVLWATVSALLAAREAAPTSLAWSLEAIRDMLWLVFLIRLLELQAGTGRRQPGLAKGRYGLVLRTGVGRHRAAVLRGLRYVAIALCLALLFPVEDLGSLLPEASRPAFPNPRLLGQVVLSVAGLVLVEQVYRNTPWEHRWGIKFLYFGLGTLFAFDFYLYSDALLFNSLDIGIWEARGAVNALIVPLLGVSAARNPQWSLDLFVSRKIVFHTTAVFAAGIYLLVMALVGYYIRLYGGEWSRILQMVFFVGAGVVLVAMLFSGQARARLKVFINKHFFSYKYDYREEWLRLIGVLSGKGLRAPLFERVIHALGEMVDSPGGGLLLWSEKDGFQHKAQWNVPGHLFDACSGLESLERYLETSQWVVNLAEYERDPDFYDGLVLPDWLFEGGRFWLIVPLLHEDTLLGVVILAKPRAPNNLDWETIDLLKTAGRQSASYLALEQAATALAEARQFEGFNRLSAFVIHDLKNLVAQLSLVVKNAERHKQNPEFIDDVILTIRNSVDKMSRLMAQLRSAIPAGRSDRIGLTRLLEHVIAERSAQRPVPRLVTREGDGPAVFADRDRLGAVIGHIVQNAQEATRADGRVDVRLKASVGEAVIEVEDDGIGMDEAFIKTRLFKPFDSTKGLTGMGIGAYECREFVTGIGGRVEVRSKPGAGTLFRIILPLAMEGAT